MLTITRRLYERIMIGDDIIIEVKEISRGQVRLSISAPRNVPVDREEVYRAKCGRAGAGIGYVGMTAAERKAMVAKFEQQQQRTRSEGDDE